MWFRSAAVVVVALVVYAGGAQAQKPKPAQRPQREETQEQLAREARISEEQAREVALKRYPNATVTATELEREHGRLIYSMELKVPGRSGVQEVNVNARTGKLVNTEHESAKTEKAEERKEAKAHEQTRGSSH